MSWATGSELFETLLVEVVDLYVPEKHRKSVLSSMIRIFEDYDCDTLSEVDDEDVQDILNENYEDMDLEDDIY